MKLIEKKCPNCGGDLEFKANDTEVTCKYCQRSFVIERDNNSIDEETYNLIYNASAGIFGASKAAFIIIGIFIFMISIVMFIVISNTHSRKITSSSNNIINNSSKDDKEEDTLESLGYVIKYSDIDESFINDIQEGGIEALNNKISFYEENFMPKIVKRWKYVGSYFLVNKKVNKDGFGTNNILYDVYEIVYKINNKNVSYFGVVRNSNFKVIDGKTVSLNNTYVELPEHHLKGIESAYGYTSKKSIYNDLVSKQLNNYTIETNTIND